MATEVKITNYWISSSALYIQLNAMGEPNYIQCSVASGASILCYMQDIEGLGYDAGHNYQRWPLVAYPSLFPDAKAKYVYVAIPRVSNGVNGTAMVVFPSERIDIYGKSIASPDKQVGNEDYYYVFLQGEISEVLTKNVGKDENDQDIIEKYREWTHTVEYGSLATDEAIASGGEGQWWRYESVHDTIKFLKTISVAAFTTLKAATATIATLFLNGHKIVGVAAENTDDTSAEKVVTPEFLGQFGVRHFLSKENDDTANGIITFLKGIVFGAEELWRITKDGIATLFSLSVKGNTQLGDNGTSTSFGDYKTDTSGAVVRVDDKGVSYMEADYITIRRAADFREITIRELRYIGGELAITPAAMQVSKVERLDASGSVIPQDDTSTEVAAYKCYFETEGTDGQKKLYQEFMPYDQARCQQWGIDAGTSEHVRTKYYWRLVTAVGTDYIILSNKTYDTSTENSEPAVGDNIVQLGYQGENRPNRQSAIILSATSTDAPSQKYYQGIHDFTLTDCVVKDEGYDAAKGTFHTHTYGDSYVGDKEGNGYMKYDSNTKTMTIKGTVHFDSDSTKDGEEIASKADLRDLNIKSGNLLRNTAFCGDYEDIEVSDDLEMTDDSEVYSDKLKYWTLSKAKVVDDADTTSGKAVLLSDGSITQQLTAPLLANSEYTLSFRGKGTTAYIEVCGVALTQMMDTDSQRYELHFSTPAEVASSLFKIKGTSCTISEIMLSYGTLAPAWSPAYSDNDKSLAEFKNLKFLTDAIAEGSTTIDGGLVMSQQFRVGNYRNKKMIKETGGMSGYYNDDNSPFLWGGGSLVQAIYTIQKYKNDPTYQPTEEEISNMAKFVVTHGGRAILNDIILRGIIYAEGGVMKSVKSPNGNFEIDEQGNLKAKEAVVENVKSTGGYFKNVSVSGNIYTPYTVINDSNKMKYGEYGLDWIALYFRLNLEASGFNVQVELKEEKRDVLIELPEDEKYLGAEVNILCTYGYLGVKNASYLSSYNINSDIQFEIKYPILFQGQTMNLKCIKVADQIRWIVLQNTDLMYDHSVQPKLIALVQTKYDASKNVYEFFNYSRGYGFWYSDSFARILYVSTGVHVVKYDNIQPPDMVIEPNVVNGFINYTVDSDKKEIKFTVYDYNHKLSDNVKFGFKIYNISRIGNYIPSADENTNN